MANMALAAKLSQINPFTYRGYYYDYDIGMYYLQSRYYDPEICRFINVDSTDYLGATGTLLSYNLFAYCENDGVNGVDPEGTTLVLDVFPKKLFSVLKKITKDKLNMDKDGKITISKKYEKTLIGKNYSNKWPIGTKLLRDLINSKKNVVVYGFDVGKGSSCMPNKFKNAVFLNKNNKVVKGIGSKVTVTLYFADKTKKSPLYIILAHELIHAYRYINGKGIDRNWRCNVHNCPYDECFVVDLSHNADKWDVYRCQLTENAIRKEHGLIKRTYYNGW